MTSSPVMDGVTRPHWSPPPSLLKVAAGDEGLIAELIEAFTTDTAVRVERILAALPVADLPVIRAEAHTIRGSALEVGASELASACQELELACDRKEAVRIAPQLRRLQGLFDEVRLAMSDYSYADKSDAALEP